MKNNMNFRQSINKLEIKKTLKDTLIVLINYTKIQGKAYPSQKTLAKKINKSERTARYAVKELENMGFIKKSKRSYLKTKIYEIDFKKILHKTPSFHNFEKKISSEIAGEIAAKRKVNKKLIIAKAINENDDERKKGKGSCETYEPLKTSMVDLSHPLSQEILGTIVEEVNTKAARSFTAGYFLNSLEKIKAMDLKKGKTIVISLKLLIKRLVGWVKRELISSEDAAVSESRSIQQTDQIQPQEKIATDLQEVCNQAQGDHPKKTDIIQILRSTFERFDRALSFKSWFSNVVIEEGEGGGALLKWSTSFDRDWVKNNFGTELRYAFTRLGMVYEFGI